jgi:hypothetical protein
MNLAGVKGGNRLREAFAGMARERVDVLLAQEHGLHAADEERLHDIADEYGYSVEASFVRRGDTRGGTLVALRRNAFGLTRRDTLKRNKHTLGGRVTIVRVPWGEGYLEYASVYVPSHAQLRRVFLQRLRGSGLLTRTMIVGADRNTVSDATLDVRYPAGCARRYGNSHAQLFDNTMARLGLSDVFRQLEGSQARSYTRLGNTVHTRIDCVFGPRRSDKYQWYSYKVTDTMYGPTWHSDHMAIVIEIKPITSTDIGPGRPRPDTEIFHDSSSLEALQDFICGYQKYLSA